MKRCLFVLVLSMMLGGCALPIGVQVASWALDGISFVATKKSMTDHGLSLVTQQDCAMWRAVKQEDICSQHEDSTTAIALLDDEDDNFDHKVVDQPTLIAEAPKELETPKGIEQLAAFETAAGDIARDVELQKSAKSTAKPTIQLVNFKNNKLRTLSSYAAETFSGTVAEIQSRGGKLSKIGAYKEINGQVPAHDVNASDRHRQNLSFVQEHSAASFSTAWAYQQGHKEPKVQWVFAASPAPQQHQDLRADITEVALYQEPVLEKDLESGPTETPVLQQTTDISPENQEIYEIDETQEIQETKNVLGSPEKHVKKAKQEQQEQQEQITDQTEVALVSAPISEPVNAEPVNSTAHVYFVVASFDDTLNATKLLNRHRSLDIQLIVGNFDGQRVYRGIVGPYRHADIEKAEKRISRAGVKNTWAVRLDPSK